MQYRTYSVDETGLTVCYAGFLREKLLWTDMTSMVLTAVAVNKKPYLGKRLAIRLAFTEEDGAPLAPFDGVQPDGTGLRRDATYLDLHFRRIILLSPTEANMRKLEEASGLKGVSSVFPRKSASSSSHLNDP